MLQYFMSTQIAELHWVAPAIDNPWGDKDNLAQGCFLRFEKVTAVLLSHGTIGDGEECLASISKVRKACDLCEEWKFRVTESSAAEGDFGLLVELENERTIEIHSDSAELFAI